MQTISISGRLNSNAEKCVDKNGHAYIRFVIESETTDIFGRDIFTHFRCTCYIPGFEEIKKGDKIYVTGKFSVRAYINSQGKPEPICNVMVYQIDNAKQ